MDKVIKWSTDKDIEENKFDVQIIIKRTNGETSSLWFSSTWKEAAASGSSRFEYREKFGDFQKRIALAIHNKQLSFPEFSKFSIKLTRPDYYGGLDMDGHGKFFSPNNENTFQNEIADGISFVLRKNSGNVGIQLSENQNKKIPDYMRQENGFYERNRGGKNMWAIPAIVFPEIFNQEYFSTLYNKVLKENDIAKSVFKDWHPEHFKKFEQGQKNDAFSVKSWKKAQHDPNLAICRAIKGGDNSTEELFLIPVADLPNNAIGFRIDESKYQKLSSLTEKADGKTIQRSNNNRILKFLENEQQNNPNPNKL